mmetsp:Transcript_3098/g.5867  ORF Transcript_3098/g.5867 Transcript_3098/m.5867 type:complete len:286 (-) Transcript_3098:1860-2717(-)
MSRRRRGSGDGVSGRTRLSDDGNSSCTHFICQFDRFFEKGGYGTNSSARGRCPPGSNHFGTTSFRRRMLPVMFFLPRRFDSVVLVVVKSVPFIVRKRRHGGGVVVIPITGSTTQRRYWIYRFHWGYMSTAAPPGGIPKCRRRICSSPFLSLEPLDTILVRHRHGSFQPFRVSFSHEDDVRGTFPALFRSALVVLDRRVTPTVAAARFPILPRRGHAFGRRSQRYDGHDAFNGSCPFPIEVLGVVVRVVGRRHEDGVVVERIAPRAVLSMRLDFAAEDDIGIDGSR